MRWIKSMWDELRQLPKAAWIPVAIFLFIGVFAPWLTPKDPIAQNLLNASQDFSADHWLGTDHLGRDTLSRLIMAARTSTVAIATVIGLALFIGVTLGAIAGYMRGVVDETVSRVIDVGLSLPSLIVALAVIGVFGTGFWIMIFALALAWWPGYARLSRAVVISILSQPYIEALRVLGASPARIMILHLMPSALGAVMVYASAEAGVVALAIATLSFLGLGIQPPTPEWGQMLVDALPYMADTPRQIILPGLALTLVVIGFNLLGESITLKRTPRSLSKLLLRRRRLQAAVDVYQVGAPTK